jgi:hypothetical protein
VCSIHTASRAFGFKPRSLRMVGAIELVSTVELLTSPVADPGAGDDQRDIAVLRVGAAVLGDLGLLAGVHDAALGGRSYRLAEARASPSARNPMTAYTTPRTT